MKERLITLISGGIDSPVAAVLAGKKFDIIPVYFCLYPMSSRENSEKGIETIGRVKEKKKFDKAIIFPYAGLITRIKNKIKNTYICVSCRRIMLLVAEMFCEKYGARGIVTGESLGQKASQTIENVRATSQGIRVPIFRPTIGMNKNEIVKISKKMGIWEAEHSSGCRVTPNKPRTSAKPRRVEDELKKVDYNKYFEDIEELILEKEDFNQNFDDYFLELESRFG